MAFMLRRFRRDERGATGIEYALIVALVALVSWVGFSHLVEASVTRTGERLNAAMASPGPGASSRSWSLSVQCDSGGVFQGDDRRGRDRCSR